jgi:hypothetical protein
MSEQTDVRLVNDYYSKWPVWFHNKVFDDKEAAPLSTELKSDLTEWARFFNEHFDYPDGWRNLDSCEEYNKTGIQLAKRVATELGPTYRVLVLLEIGRGKSIWRRQKWGKWVKVQPIEH